jgi:hypothetical protein
MSGTRPVYEIVGEPSLARALTSVFAFVYLVVGHRVLGFICQHCGRRRRRTTDLERLAIQANLPAVDEEVKMEKQLEKQRKRERERERDREREGEREGERERER